MPLKLRGSSQFKPNSISLDRLQVDSSKSILGYDSEGNVSGLSASSARTNMGIATGDDVTFSQVTSSSALISNSTLAVTGNTTVGGTLGVTGTSTLTGKLTTEGDVEIQGALEGTSADFSTTLNADGNATLGGTLSVDSNATIGGTLGVTGISTFTGDIDANGACDINGALTGSTASFSSTLNATGDTTLGANLSVTGNSTLTGTLNVNGNVVLGNAETDTVTIAGNLIVNGDSTEVNVSSLQVEDPIIQMGKGNPSDALDLGFIGLYKNGVNDEYAGLLRDASDSDNKWYLFSTSQDISSSTAPSYDSNDGYSKNTLVADIQGDITYENDVTFSLGGDFSGSATFDGTSNVTISATIENSSVQYDDIDFLDTSDALGTSDVKVPSQGAVKAYVDASVSSGGLTDLETKDMQMVDSTGKFIKVKQVFEYSVISSDDESNDYVTVSTEIESEFKDLSNVYLNGQKLRFSSNDGTSNDYWFSETGPSATLHATTLTASDQSASDVYTAQGLSMSDDGNILAVVSRDWDRAGGGSNHGGVYIYDWNSVTEVWDQRGDVFSPPSDATNGVLWGHSVSLSSDGSYMAVGSVLHTETVSQQGGVFVYEWNDSTSSWDSHGSVAVAEDAGFGDRHIMPSLSGDASVLAVGAFSWDGTGKTNDGKVYIYDWDSTDEEWDERTTINASDAASYDYFGIDVSLSNDASILAVGAGSWEGDTSDQGGVYIYDWTDTNSDGNPDTFVQRGDVIESNNPSNGAHFGYGVELNNAGTTLIVGSLGASANNSPTGEGKAEIFDWNSSTSSWDFRTSVSDPVSNGMNFGGSVAINSDATKFVVGSYGNGSTVAGRAHTYDLTNTSTTNKVNFNNGVISENDKLEINYIIKS